jgi:hypothetical protein
MNASHQPERVPETVVPLLAAPCGFPDCGRETAAGSAMCQRHRRVRVSSTGSWLEAG